MAKMLSKAFFNREADTVARELLGKILCIQKGTKIIRLPITETEAYLGPQDLACHSSKGRTKRTEVMFSEAGTIYIYLIYGMYTMLNVVTRENGYPAAVLIRGAGTFDGPGKLTKALGIARAQNGMSLGKKAGIWIEDAPPVPNTSLITTPRIGVAYAGDWALKELRFVWKPDTLYTDAS